MRARATLLILVLPSLFISATLVALLAGEAPQAGKVRRIGYLSSGTATTTVELHQAFADGLRDHGWVEGKNIAVDHRWQGASGVTFGALAAELAELPLELVFTVNTPEALASKRAGTRLPVVFATVSEPVAIGLVASLARPGANFTGLTTINRELMSKRLQVLKEAMPSLMRVGYMANPGYVIHQVQLTEMDAAARGLGLVRHLAEVQAPSEFGGTFAGIAATGVGAFIAQQDDLFIANRQIIFELATRRRLAGMYSFSLYARASGLMSYGANAADLYRRAAGYVDRILLGARPADLPVERPTKLELLINLKTAQALGLTIPPTLLFQADEVIQ